MKKNEEPSEMNVFLFALIELIIVGILIWLGII